MLSRTTWWTDKHGLVIADVDIGTVITDDRSRICVESDWMILDSLVDVQDCAMDLKLLLLPTLAPWMFHSPSEAKKATKYAKAMQ